MMRKSSLAGASALKRKSIRATASLSSTLTAAASTVSADVNARQVTRAEFMELSAIVAQLRKDLLRLQAVGKWLSS